MTQWLDGLPAGLLFAAVLTIGVVRGHLYYLAGRGAETGVTRTAGGRADRWERPRALVARWGAWAIVPSYFVVGLSMSVLIASGAARMPLRRFTPALVLGATCWAALVAWVGSTLVETLVR